MRSSLRPMAIITLLLIGQSVAAQTAAEPTLPTLVIPRLGMAPVLDTFVTMQPSSAAIGGMVRVDNFTQRWPDDGKPERIRTVAYLGYTDDALHVVYLAFDPEPSALRAHLVRREEVFTVNDDAVELRLDTYGDRRQSYYLVSNPLGVQLDAAWPEQGGQYDDSFDLVWQSRGQRTTQGFVVLITVPFRSLRFRPATDQKWGVYLGRWIPRTGEWNFWPPISIRQQSYLAQMASLEGLRNVTRGRGVQLIPYGSFRSFRALDQRDRARPRFVRDLSDANVGLDAKVVVRDSLVVDATVNPDFSQVESDAPQITANQRFEVFFPEKRPFFLENAGFLQTPINLMFTRRIADPRAGGKLTGRARAWSVGAIVSDDEAPGKRVADHEPLAGSRAVIGAARVSRNVFSRSNVGGIVTRRAIGGRVNTVSAIDSRLRVGRVWTVDGQWAVSSLTSPAATGADFGRAYFFGASRNGRTVSARTEIDGRSPDFVADLGFVPRVDVHEITQTVSYTARPARTLTDWGPSMFLERTWAYDGTPLDARARPGLNFNFIRSTTFSVFAEASRVTLRPGDAPNVPAPMSFRPDSWAMVASSSPRPAWSAAAEITAGKAINLNPAGTLAPDLGGYLRTRVSLGIRPLTALRIENTWLRAALESRGAQAFASNIVRTQWAWQFTREWSLRLIGQYDAITADATRSALAPRRNLNADLLLTRLINPWTALYVGYNGNAQNLSLVADPTMPRLQRTSALERDSWQVFVKWSHLLRW